MYIFWIGINIILILHAFFFLHFLRHNLALALGHTKEVVYKTLVQPQLEYATSIWHHYNKIRFQWWRRCKGLQPGGRAGDGQTPVHVLSVDDMLDELEWPFLEVHIGSDPS